MDAPLHLRPMSIGEILDRSFRLYRNHFLKLFFAVLVVMCVEFIAIQFFMAYSFMPLWQFISTQREFPLGGPILMNAIVGGLAFVFLHFIVNILFLGALVHLISDCFLNKPTSVGTAYRLTFRRLGPLVYVNWLKLSILSACLLFWLAPMIISLATRTWWVAAAWVIMGILPALFAYLWLVLASIVLLLEEKTVWESIKRSGRLMFTLSEKGILKNNSFRVSIILLVIFAIRTFVMMVGQAPFMAWKSFQMFRDPSLLGQYHRTPLDSIFEFVNMLMQAATTPFGMATLVLFYYDICIRKEGLDLSMRLKWLREKASASEAPKA